MTAAASHASTESDIVIRRAESVADYRACQEAQRRAWGITDDGYLVPIATMVGANLHGGLVLGAFRPSGEAVGLSFAFLGKVEGEIGLYSQLTGVVPGLQGQGLGYRLKQAQFDFARREGIPVVAWAFDPLQAGNAHFNLDRLGALGIRFIDNMYGTRTDALNAGVPTDRLIAVWRPDARPSSHSETSALDVASLPRLLDPKPSHLAPALVERKPIPAGAARLLLEIPADINALRAADPARAELWRQAVRDAFVTALHAGFQATATLRTADHRAYHILARA